MVTNLQTRWSYSIPRANLKERNWWKMSWLQHQHRRYSYLSHVSQMFSLWRLPGFQVSLLSAQSHRGSVTSERLSWTRPPRGERCWRRSWTRRRRRRTRALTLRTTRFLMSAKKRRKARSRVSKRSWEEVPLRRSQNPRWDWTLFCHGHLKSLVWDHAWWVELSVKV